MDPEQLIPHSGAMCWLDRVLDHDPERTRCSLAVRGDTPLAGTGDRVPALAALEYMAQTAAVHAVLAARAVAGGVPPARVALLGTRSLELRCAWLDPGETLVSEAVPIAGSTAGLAVFATSVRDSDGREIASAKLNLFAEAAHRA